MDVMKVGYAVKGHIIVHKPPRDGAGFAVMQGIKRIGKVSDMHSARFDRCVERFRIGFGVTYEDAHTGARKIAHEAYAALYLRRDRHQPSRRPSERACEYFNRFRIATISPEVFPPQRPASLVAHEGPLEMHSQDPRALLRTGVLVADV